MTNNQETNTADVEKAFEEFIDIQLEEHENFQNGFEDARSAFNEQFEDHEPFDVADNAFAAGARSRDEEVEQLKKALIKYDEALTRYLDAEDMVAKRVCDKEAVVIIDEIRTKHQLNGED